jgi:hypothetical protein
VATDDDECDQLDDASHLVVDHEAVDKSRIDSQLAEFHRKCRAIEYRRSRKLIRRSNIMPPSVVSSLWPHLRAGDLHPGAAKKAGKTPPPRKMAVSPLKRSHAAMERASNACPERASDATVTPSKRLNKAVGRIFERTPTKSLAEADADLLNLGDDFSGLEDIEVDRDLVSSILGDEKFVEDVLKSPSLKEPHLDDEFVVVKTWFNQVRL